MRNRRMSAALLGLLALAGCGGEETTDPNKLTPLTAADLEEIKREDARVEEEERGQPFVNASGTKPGKSKKAHR